jgi:hypothetical protein
VLHCSAAHGAAAGAVCLLLKAGADPTATDTNGSTAAHVAGMRGHFALEALLSRAAEDYRKAHATAQTAAGSSTSSSSVYSSTDAAKLSSTTGTSNDSSAASAAASRATKAGTASVTALPNVSSSRGTVSSTSTGQQQQQQQQQSEARKAKQPFANCKKPTTKLCRRCAAVHYCSVACQKVCFKDPTHRAQCEAKANEIM